MVFFVIVVFVIVIVIRFVVVSVEWIAKAKSAERD